VPLLLVLHHGLEVMQEQSLGQGTGEGLVQRDIGHSVEGDAGDHNFDRNLFTNPAAVN
jgi:hypothetical protein